jgi:patatin-like phospholipase/acyl hydrolase
MVLLCLFAGIASKTPMYSILSIDGGGIRGIIPAKVIENIEEFAYNYYIS